MAVSGGRFFMAVFGERFWVRNFCMAVFFEDFLYGDFLWRFCVAVLCGSFVWQFLMGGFV